MGHQAATAHASNNQVVRWSGGPQQVPSWWAGMQDHRARRQTRHICSAARRPASKACHNLRAQLQVSSMQNALQPRMLLTRMKRLEADVQTGAGDRSGKACSAACTCTYIAGATPHLAGCVAAVHHHELCYVFCDPGPGPRPRQRQDRAEQAQVSGRLGQQYGGIVKQRRCLQTT